MSVNDQGPYCHHIASTLEHVAVSTVFTYTMTVTYEDGECYRKTQLMLQRRRRSSGRAYLHNGLVNNATQHGSRYL